MYVQKAFAQMGRWIDQVIQQTMLVGHPDPEVHARILVPSHSPSDKEVTTLPAWDGEGLPDVVR